MTHNASSNQTSPPARPPAENARPLRTAVVVIYATLGLLAVAIPQSLVNRVRDIHSTAIEEALLPAAELLQQASERTGVTVPYRHARALFLAVTGKVEN